MNNHPIQILAEGHSQWQRLIRRWGLSILIGEEVLFDTFGDPKYLMRQIKKKKIDIAKINHIILSHEHWDHINGLWSILAINPAVTVYLGRHFSENFKTRVKVACQKMIEIEKSVHIDGDIYSTEELRGTYNGRFLYESGLVIKKDDGLTLIVGCAHPGIILMVQNVKAQFGGAINQLIGGLHLKDMSKFEVDAVVKKLQEEKIATIFACHCTGKYAQNLQIRSSGAVGRVC